MQQRSRNGGSPPGLCCVAARAPKRYIVDQLVEPSGLQRCNTMPRKRFADLEQPRRNRILGAAAHEFAERGYEAASVNRIITEAGISKGSLYYYFDDKEDLVATEWLSAIRSSGLVDHT